MVISSSGSASRPLAVVIALFVLMAGLGFYAAGAWDPAAAGPAPAASTASELPHAAPAAVETVAGGVERHEVTPARAEQPGAAASAPAPVVPEQATAATVYGKVVDVRGIGIAGAKVAVLKNDQLPAGLALGLPRELREAGSDGVQTDAAGDFAMRLRALGPFELIVSHDEHPSTRHAGAADGPRVVGVRIVLRDGGSITGTVAGAPADAGELTVVARLVEEGVAAAAGAAASAMFDFGAMFEGLDLPVGARRTTAAADGTFRLGGLEPGARFSLCALRQLQAGQPTRCTERAEVREGSSGVQLRWRETLGLVVRVLDADTGAAIEDLDVSVGPVSRMVVLGMSMPIPMRQPVPQHHFTGGIVQLDGIGVDDKNATLSIEVRAPGRRPWSRDDVDATRPLRIDLGTVQLAAAPVVRVTVVCGGEPVAGAAVRLEKVEDARSEAGGARGMRSISFSATATAPAGDGQEPAQHVQLGERDTRVATDARGVCELTADCEGRARVVVESALHAPCRGEPFDLPRRGVVEQRAELWRGGTASVRAVDGHGAPLANAAVRRVGAEPKDTETATTDAEGTLVFLRLLPGAHTFAIEAAGKAAGGVRIDLGAAAGTDAAGVTVAIADGQTALVLLTAPLRGSLRGVVTLDGQPLDRAEVRVVDVPRDGEATDASAEVGAAVASMLGGLVDQGQRATTGADGDYELAGVRTGARRVLVTHKRLAMAACSDATIVEGSNLLDIALRSTTVRGRVLDQGGNPVAGAAVSVAPDAADADATAAGIEEATATFGALFGGGGREAVRTAADGTFELAGVRPGVPLRVRASSRLHVADSVRVDAVPTGSARDGIELRLAAAGRVRVHAAVEGALAVRAEWAGGSPAPKGAGAARSAMLKSGRATLEGLPPGRWQLVLEGSPALAARGLERTVDVAAGQLASVEF